MLDVNLLRKQFSETMEDFTSQLKKEGHKEAIESIICVKECEYKPLGIKGRLVAYRDFEGANVTIALGVSTLKQPIFEKVIPDHELVHKSITEILEETFAKEVLRCIMGNTDVREINNQLKTYQRG